MAALDTVLVAMCARVRLVVLRPVVLRPRVVCRVRAPLLVSVRFQSARVLLSKPAARALPVEVVAPGDDGSVGRRPDSSTHCSDEPERVRWGGMSGAVRWVSAGSPFEQIPARESDGGAAR